MRKVNTILILLLGIHYYAKAQSVLTKVCNGFRDGDSLVMYSTDCLTSGMSGRNAVWDFSEIRTGPVHIMEYSLEGECMTGIENGTMWRTAIQGDNLLLTGFENRHTLVELDTPLPILRYPFSYGDSIRGCFKGIGRWCDRRFMRVWGDGVTHADGEGTLILPSEDTLRNVLRVHSVRRIWQYSYNKILTWNSLLEKVIQEDGHGLFHDSPMMSPVVTETYAWYAQGWRYPILRMELVSDDICTTSLAVLYPPESQMDLYEDTENLLLRHYYDNPNFFSFSDEDHGRYVSPMTSHSAYYNPYTGNVTLSFFLSRPASVTLLLSDITGVKWRSCSQEYDVDGSYSLPLNCVGLPHGQYVLRITCDAFVYTEKFNVR